MDHCHWLGQNQSSEPHQAFQFRQSHIEVIVDHDCIEFSLGIEFLTGPSQSFLNRLFGIGTPSSNALLQLSKAGRCQEDLKTLWEGATHLPSSLQLDLEQNRCSCRQLRFNWLAGCAVTVACKFSPLQQPTIGHQSIKAFAAMEEIVLTVLLTLPW